MLLTRIEIGLSLIFCVLLVIQRQKAGRIVRLQDLLIMILDVVMCVEGFRLIALVLTSPPYATGLENVHLALLLGAVALLYVSLLGMNKLFRLGRRRKLAGREIPKLEHEGRSEFSVLAERKH